MSTLSCRVYKGHTDQNAPVSGTYGVDTCISPLTAITFCQVPPNPMAIPKPILLDLKRRPQRTFRFKSKHQFMREQRSKYTRMTFDPNLMVIIPNEREVYELQLVQIVGYNVTHAQSYGW